MFLACRNPFQDKIRLALSINGVALVITLILILKGFLAGMNGQITLKTKKISLIMNGTLQYTAKASAHKERFLFK